VIAGNYAAKHEPHSIAGACRKATLLRIGLSIVLLITLVGGCSSVISNSEDFYKDSPRRRINWREYMTD
jgi:hypothetical protein